MNLLKKYNLLDNRLGFLKVKPHKILLNDYTPFAFKPFSFPEKLKLATEQKITRLLNEKIIRPSCSEFASRAFPIEKKQEALGW